MSVLCFDLSPFAALFWDVLDMRNLTSFAALHCQGPEELRMCRACGGSSALHPRGKAMRQGKSSDLLINCIFLFLDAARVTNYRITSILSLPRICDSGSIQLHHNMTRRDLFAHCRRGVIVRQEIHASKLLATTMEGGLRLMLPTYTTSTYAGCM